MHCRICGKKTKGKRLCQDCKYFLSKGVTEGTIRATYSDDRAKRIWKENEKLAEDLAEAYYESTLENYKERQVKKGTKENLGFNTFIEGIMLGLGIVMPLLSEDGQAAIKNRIKLMVEKRRKLNKKLKS